VDVDVEKPRTPPAVVGDEREQRGIPRRNKLSKPAIDAEAQRHQALTGGGESLHVILFGEFS